MHAIDLNIQNFRNIQNIQLAADPGVNIIYGENAQGKTNIIEAIWLFTGAKSFRGAKDSQLLRIGEQQARLQLAFFCENRKQTAQIVIETRKKTYLNEVELNPPSALAGHLQAIVFAPQDLGLVNDGPAARRRMLDLGIGLLYPSYIQKLKTYNHTLQQRNALLKTLRFNASMYPCLEDYDVSLSRQGAEIIRQRQRYTAQLKEEIPGIYNGLADGREALQIAYTATADTDPERYYAKLQAQQKEDLKNIATSVGPHRDELEIHIEGKPARMYASQGQRRSAALTLKLAQAALIKKATGEQPIALLDDVLSELDEKRQHYILNHIKNWQVFITCCDPSQIERMTKGKVFRVQNGTLAEA